MPCGARFSGGAFTHHGRQRRRGSPMGPRLGDIRIHRETEEGGLPQTVLTAAPAQILHPHHTQEGFPCPAFKDGWLCWRR